MLSSCIQAFVQIHIVWGPVDQQSFLNFSFCQQRFCLYRLRLSPLNAMVRLYCMHCYAVVCVPFTHCLFVLLHLFMCMEILSCFPDICGTKFTGDAVCHTFDLVLLEPLQQKSSVKPSMLQYSGELGEVQLACFVNQSWLCKHFQFPVTLESYCKIGTFA